MVSQTAQQQTQTRWVLDPAHSSIDFAVKHMMITTVRGRFAKFDAEVDFDEAHPERTRVQARIEAASIDTGEPQRDAHLRSPDFLDAEHSPWLTFASRRVEPLGGSRYRVAGDLTIRGVAREVSLDVELAGVVKDPWGNQRAGITAQATVNRKDFGLTWNLPLEAGGLVVGDTVKISIEVELVKKGE